MNQIYTILLATSSPIRIDFAELNARLGRPAVQKNLNNVELADPIAFLSMLALDEEGVSRFVGEGDVNTDARTYVGYLRGKESDLDGSDVLVGLRPHFTSEADGWLVAESSQISLLEWRLSAREHSVEGLIHMMKGDWSEANRQFQVAQTIDPEEVMAKRLAQVVRSKGKSRY